MFKTIDWPANCEIREVVKFLNAKNVRPCEIYRQISESQSGPRSDFHLFSHFKKFLAGQHFASDDEIKVKSIEMKRSSAFMVWKFTEKISSLDEMSSSSSGQHQFKIVLSIANCS
ncbi:hypothetical protein AVEN_266888-1 [Araneus ventricosus]|uniref:Uncharacterized protein n=1 Tax=Araneus ventricosus TaxID=182803 RepID=A0A4Y2I1K8_ARAVE|nr:hypothetical protein AVEN_266888-1 [Araneus ventricosus]